MALALLSSLFVALGAVGVAYQAYALLALSRFFAQPPAPSAPPAPVTLIKPLHGAEPHLAANLASFLAQDYSAPVQMLCGVNAAEDAAVPAVRDLIARYPQADIALHPGPRLPGANGKMGNCAAMMPLARHDVLILSDSDMVVESDYLARMTATLAQPGVGAVSCLYVGRGDAGVWSRIGAAMISAQSLPNMVVGLSLGMARPCMGSTIALRRATLDAIGGFAAFADVLADDHAIGAAVAKLGQRIAIPPLVLVHAGAEGSARALWRQHLRWAATIRDLAGAGHYGSLVTHALPLCLIAAVAMPTLGLPLFFAAALLRFAMVIRVNHLAPGARVGLWALPAADLFAFAIFCASLTTRKIDWRGSSLTMMGNGRIAHHENAPRKTAARKMEDR